MKILITGSKGMLAQDLIRVLKPKHRIIRTDVNNMDITKNREVVNFFIKNKPEIVIHTAAYTNVDGAEKEKTLALKVNQFGTKNVAKASQKLNIPIVYISTDYIFGGGKKRPYSEKDRPNPLSIYGKSKYKGEQEILKDKKKYFIIRSAWLYGKGGKNFISTILELAKQNPTLKIVNDQEGSPTYTLDLAKAIAKIIKKEKYGIYHIVNSGSCTWYQFTKEIAKIRKLKNNIIPISSKDLKRPAKRPRYSVLSTHKVKSIGINMRKWGRALKDFLSKEKDL